MTDLFVTVDPASVLSLTELNRNIKQALRDALPETYWVRAETSEVRVNSYSGHCYLEFVEKDERTGQVAARARGTIWAQQYAVIRPYFEEETGRPFTSGLKVLVRVAVDFHELYGLSLTVHDIDPSFTVGDLVRRRKEIVRQLQADGVFDLNRSLSLPPRPQRIAVISSATAAGYEDFTNQLLGNEYGFPFYVRLYPALMQGERTEASIIAALDRIYAVREAFDVVVIIRGGGATSDLSGFDTLELAENVANFPLPIITGIGHERDQSILDLVAFRSVKTPTAAAALLIDHLTVVYDRVTGAGERLVAAVGHRMEVEQLRLRRLGEKLPIVFSLFRERQEVKLHRLFQAMTAAVATRLSHDSHRLELLERRLRPAATRRLEREEYRLRLLRQRAVALDPALLLKRGYSITTCDGRVVRSAAQLRKGDEIVTRLEKGSVKSIIK